MKERKRAMRLEKKKMSKKNRVSGQQGAEKGKRGFGNSFQRE